jgi:hypothetical protein
MTETIEESKCLASLAVFRELYNSEKDIYGIISEFLVDLIISNSKHSFNLTEITNLLNQEYDFSIPEAVVRTSINRIKSINRIDGIYTLKNLSDLKSKNVNVKKEQIQNSNDRIIESLFNYIEKHLDTELSSNEKSKVVHSFISFIIDNANGNNYSQYISAFIISKKDDEAFKEQLSTIKEGVVLYSGIKYNTNINDLGTWKTDLTIFIETEILFHYAGLNGEVYQKLWQDFFNYVKEINHKHPNRIQLRYFNDVNSEIERFFKKAEYIIEGKDKANPKVTAMMSIIDGCETKADIVSKKAEFFRQLKLSGIKENEFNDYFNEKYHKYNIVDQEILSKVSEDLGIEDPSQYLRFLNYVSIHRKEANENNFENVGYILLSGNSKTLQIAWNENIKSYGFVPLATTLSFLTNKFWFKLNKGFGKGNFPLTFDVITKAQIVLSNQINDSVGKKFEELQAKFKAGNIDEEQAKASIIELRRQTKKPEDVRSEEIESILESISEESIEVFLKEQEHFKNKAISESLENNKLKSSLSQKEVEVKSHIEKQRILNSKIIETKKTLLKEKEGSISILEQQKSPIDREIEKSILSFKVTVSVLIITAFIGTHIGIWKLGWNDSEQWTWILFYLIPLFLSVVYMLFTEKTINPIELIKSKKERIVKAKYGKFNFDNNLLKRLKDERNELKKEVQELESQHTTMAKKT